MSRSQLLENDATISEPTESIEDQTRSGFISDSGQPKDVFSQLDSTVRDISEKFSKEPYMSSVYQLAIQSIPGIDPLTKTKLAQGDTTQFKEVYGIPALHYLNQYLFNYPRSIASSLGMEYPEAETPAGKVLSKGAGIAGALQQFQTGLGLAKKALPMKALGGSTVRTGVRGAVAGGIQGAIYSPEDPFDIKTRGQQAGVGAVVGGLLAPVSSKIATFIRKKKLRGKTSLKGRVGVKRADVDLRKTLEDVEGAKVVKEANSLLTQSQKELQDTIAVQQIRGKVPVLKVASVKHGKNLSKIYETTVGDLSDEINDTTTTLGAFDHFKQFLGELGADEGLKGTLAFKRISSFIDDITDDLSFKDLNRMRHKITGKKIYRGDIDDVVYTRFRQSFNEFAENADTTGKFKALNKWMAPQLEFKHALNKKLNTFKKYETSGAEKLVKKYADRNVNPKGISQGEIDLMDDAMQYFKKYGVDTKDIEAIYQGKAKDIATVQSVAAKMQEFADEASGRKAVTSAISKNIRQKQSIKIAEIDIAKAKHLIGNAINTVIRLSLAGMALNAFHEFKKGVGGGGDAIPTNTAVQ